MQDFYIEKKVYYHDTDCGGVMYYATYLHFLEESRFEFCLSKGVDLNSYAKEGVIFPVVHVEVDYKSPARYADKLNVFTRIEKIGTSSLHFAHEIKKGDHLVISAKVIWACVGEDFKIKKIPQPIRQALA